jgi:invasion protein IalB
LPQPPAFIALCIAGFMAALPAAAQQPGNPADPVDRFGAWTVHVERLGEEMRCWAQTVPTDTRVTDAGGSPAAIAPAGTPRLSVSAGVSVIAGHRYDFAEEVNVDTGHAIRPGTRPALRIDSGRPVALEAEGSNGWVGAADEAAVVAAMRAGRAAVASAVTAREFTVTQTYSLMGFTRAEARSRALCP